MENPPISCEILLGNTYHLADQPGAEVLAEHEGLHKFMNFTKNILTDSGGFQMVSLLKLAEISEEGVNFESPENGTMMMLTPEESIETQHNIGSDIIMVLDDVVHSLKLDMERFEVATDRTIRWLDRCILTHLTQKQKRYSKTGSQTENNHKNILKRKLKHSKTKKTEERNKILNEGYRKPPSLFAIVQGWLDCKPGGMRNRCLDKMLLPDKDIKVSDCEGFLSKNKELFNIKEGQDYIRDNYIDGYAIGGLAGGESKEDFINTVYTCCQRLPKNKPRYLMGVGYPEDIVICVCLGVDMFDCVYPTRTARFGTAFSKFGLVKLKNSKSSKDLTILAEGCICKTCEKGYSKAALHYLLRSCPSQASALITHHNLVYMLTLSRTLREAILNKDLQNYVSTFVKNYFKDKEIPQWCVDALKRVNMTI